jgi:hypothetical protein
VRILCALAIFMFAFARALLATLGILRSQGCNEGAKQVFCALLATFSLCTGILQFISVELVTFSFCVGIIHIISVDIFTAAKTLGEGGGCCSEEENDRRRLWGPRHAPVALLPK